MSRFMLLAMLLTVALVQAAGATTISISVANSGFEDYLIVGTNPNSVVNFGNAVPCQYSATFGNTHDFGALPTGIGWTFGDSTNPSFNGLIRDGGWGDAAYAGSQMAFFEGTGSISQALSGFHTGTATVSFYAAGRSNFGPNGIKATINGTELTFGESTTITPTNSVWALYTSNEFNVTSGVDYTLTILGTIPFSAGTDMSSYVDNVSVSNTYTIPEPSAVILFVTGLVGMLAYAWRKQK